MEDFAGGKKYTKRGWRQYPDRFWWFSTIKDPKAYPTERIARQDLEEGAAGIKLFPGFLHAPVDHEAFLDTFATCADMGARVLISFEALRPPQTLSLPEYAEQLDGVLERFPDLNFCLLHNGCADPLTPEIEPIYRLMERHANLYLSTAYPGEQWDDGSEYPFPNYLRRIEALVRQVGTERVMWATDWPWFEGFFKYEQGVNAILRHAGFMSQAEKEEFMGGAAMRFMGEEVPET
jgi:predicted TIM-barrel fold metal-dependent hydrolase